MIIGVPKETVKGERRVALVPESISRLISKGHKVIVESGAGMEAGFLDKEYKKSGALLSKGFSSLYDRAQVILKVQKPIFIAGKKNELSRIRHGSLLIGFFWPHLYPSLVQQARRARIHVFAMDAIPRISRAQRMDALSSQTNLAGYKAAIVAAENLSMILPMMMTAAGTITPAKVLILGAGVAGLQAIATSRRLGAVVEVSDVRPAVKEQVESLGARYIDPPKGAGEGKGGYAKQAGKDFLLRQQKILQKHAEDSDVVITTALVPGKKAPRLLSKKMIEGMRPGSVVVDMAAEQGGNCELTKPGKTVVHRGVKIIGLVNIPSELSRDASILYSRNITAVIELITGKNGNLSLDLDDEIIKEALVVKSDIGKK